MPFPIILFYFQGAGNGASDLLGNRPVDERRAEELLSKLSVMERIGVRVLQREQEKVRSQNTSLGAVRNIAFAVCLTHLR